MRNVFLPHFELITDSDKLSFYGKPLKFGFIMDSPLKLPKILTYIMLDQNK